MSEEESEVEQALVHPAVQALDFPLTKPDPRALPLNDPDQVPAVPAQKPFALAQQHIITAPEILPVTQVALEHQSTLLEANAASILAASRKKNGSTNNFNVMSFSSGHLASQSNDLLYTDAHAPYTFSKHGKPLSIWIVSKPGFEATTGALARKLQEELGNAGTQTVLPNGGAAVPSRSGREQPPPSRMMAKDYSSHHIALITPEFLLSHAKESSSTAGSPVFPGIDEVLQGLAEGRAVSKDTLFKLFIFALHSERLAFHGYILPDCSFLPLNQDLDTAISKSYPALQQRGLWPPQHVVELQVDDEEVLARIQRGHKTNYITRRIGDTIGFKEPKEIVAVPAPTLLEDGSDASAAAAAAAGPDSAPPSAPAGNGGVGSLSRPTSAMSRRGEDPSNGGDDPALDYALCRNLHRGFETADWDDVAYDRLGENALLASAAATPLGAGERALGGQGPIVQRHLRLKLQGEMGAQQLREEIAEFETHTREQIRRLVATWSQFHPEGSALTSCSTQRLHSLAGALPLPDLVHSVLSLLGQNKWSSGFGLVQPLPWVVKEEGGLRVLDETGEAGGPEIRELLPLPNVHKDVAGVAGPTTNDPSGLDLESEAAFESCAKHLFGPFQTSCPVALLTDDKIVAGSEAFAASFGGNVFFMSSAVALRKFRDNPLKYTSVAPSLPRNFVLSVVGGPSTGKTTLSAQFATKFGWTLHSMDGTEEGLLAVAAAIAAAGGGQHVLDGGPATLPLLELAAAQGLTINKVLYLFVDDVEVLPARLRAQQKALSAPDSPLDDENERKKEAAAAAVAAAASPKASKKKPKPSSASSSSGAGGSDDEPTPEEEDLMDRVDEFQNDVWPNVLLPYLEEHAYSCVEVNNSPVTPPPANANNTPSMLVSVTPPAANVAATDPAPGGQLPAATLAAIDAVFCLARRAVDPFFNYRWVSAARRLSPEAVERSWKEEDRVPKGLPPSVMAAAAAIAANPAAAAAAGNNGANSSSASQAGTSSSDNPRGLRFGDVNFCPVCLVGSSGQRVPGLASDGVSIGVHSYSCCSPSCAEAFVAAPAKFNLNSSGRLAELAPRMPSLRVMVTGARGSGKSYAAKLLQAQYKLAYSFSLGDLLFPALKNLAASTLTLVAENDALEATKRAAAAEARKVAKKARRDAALAAKVAAKAARAAKKAAAAAAKARARDEEDEDEDEEEDEEEEEDDDEEEEEEDEDAEDSADEEEEAEALAQQAALDAEKKDPDLLKLYLATSAANIQDHAAILSELLEEEWFSDAQLEQLLRDIFASHAWVDRSGSAARDASNAAGWVCEVDLHSPPLLARLNTVLREGAPTTNFAKPHIILPMECAADEAVGRLVAREQHRKLTQPPPSPSDDSSVSSRAPSAASSSGGEQAAVLRSLSAKHRSKQEALEKAARDLREKEEAAAKPKRFGSAGAKKAAPAASPKVGKNKTKKEIAAELEAEKLAAEEKRKEEEAAAAAVAAAAEAAAAANAAKAADAATEGAPAAEEGEKSEAALALEAEMEARAAAEARALEELTSILSELVRASLDASNAFLSVLRARPGVFGFVLARTLSSSSPPPPPIAGEQQSEESLAEQVEKPLGFAERLQASLASFLQAQSALFQPMVDLSMSDSNKLLRNGMRTLRAFGTYCPCCLLPAEGSGAIARSYDCKVSLSNSGGSDYFPLVWAHNVILTCSRAHRQEFARDARKYLSAPPPPPIVAPRIVVLESAAIDPADDASMSATLARKLAQDLNLVHLTLSGILTALAAPSCSNLSLGAAVREALVGGQRLSDALLVRCVAHAVQAHATRARLGWVLEGFPQTVAQARLLKQAGVVPHEVFAVHDTTATGTPAPSAARGIKRPQRAQFVSRLVSALEDAPASSASGDLPGGPHKRRRGVSALLPPSLAHLNMEEAVVGLPSVAVAVAATAATPSSSASVAAPSAVNDSAPLERFFQSNYNNVSALYTGAAPNSAGAYTPNSSLRSAGMRIEYALGLVRAHVRLRQDYFVATQAGAATFSASRPGRVAHLGLTRAQLLEHASEYGDYCPVAWVRDGILDRSEGVRGNAWTVEYRQRFYRVCSEEYREAFEAAPDSFANSGVALPKDLPFVLFPADAARVDMRHCELSGFCPVSIRTSLLQGSSLPLVVPGAVECSAFYRGGIFRMRGAKELAQFMSLPAVYSSVRLPQKMPPMALSGGVPKRSPADLLALGKTLAFMEVEFSALLMRAVNSFEKIFPHAPDQRIKFPALPVSSTALLYIALYLKTHNPRNPPHIKEKYQNKMKEFIAHCALIPTVAAEYKASAAAPPKPVEESKEQDSAPPAASASLVESDAAVQYDTLRTEMRAHAAHSGSRQGLAQFFERYLR